MHKRILLPLLVLCIHTYAQNKPVTYEQQSWAGWYPQVKFSKHWGIWFDSEIHTNDHYFNGFSQAVFRLAASYYNPAGNKFTAGYGYTDYFPGETHPTLSIPEHFTWEQYQWFGKGAKHKLMQWLRLEQKFKENLADDHTLAGTFTTTHRFRYNVFYTHSLSSKGMLPHALSLALGDELYLYYGANISNHVFEQNRIFLGFSYALNPHDNLVFGITNIFQENVAGTAYSNLNVLRVSLFQNLDL